MVDTRDAMVFQNNKIPTLNKETAITWKMYNEIPADSIYNQHG